jgi:hypothetical protein
MALGLRPLWKEKLTILHADVEAFRAAKLYVPDIPPRKKQAQLLTTYEINGLRALLVHAGLIAARRVFVTSCRRLN